jgi:alpha-beta hydrolase superfamily lysophospholipase
MSSFTLSIDKTTNNTMENHLLPEQLIYKRIRDCNYDNNEINLPKTDEYFDYEDYKLHLRSYWPEKTPKAVVLFVHGYVSSVDRPTHGYLGPYFASKDIAYIGFDFPGHGYSTGDRALVVPVDELIKITIRVIEIIFSEENRSSSYYIERNDSIKRNTPLFLIGHSMGGAVALLVGKELKFNLASQYNFMGTCFLCPALKIVTLSPALRFLIDYVLAPCFPSTSIPEMLNRPFNPKATWNDDDYIKYVQSDYYPKGLSWGETVKFGSLSVLLELAESAFSSIPSVDYPWIMFHDPDDKTVDFAGAKDLFENCETTKDKKQLVIIEGSGHDILINRLGEISKQTMDWIDGLLSAYAGSGSRSDSTL